MTDSPLKIIYTSWWAYFIFHYTSAGDEILFIRQSRFWSELELDVEKYIMNEASKNLLNTIL